MQGRHHTSNLERKGPHKSMHCKFCKPPGAETPEKCSRLQLETKTKIHLVHEAADLKLLDISDEPGVPDVDVEACVCVLEGENSCPKCAPDKNRGPQKKKVCRCPKGAKPNPNLNDGKKPKKIKRKDEDNEFWWEKYSREHDALTRETWAAYMAQRRKDKKLIKCQKREQQERLLSKKDRKFPTWYHKFSCQQVIYVECLSTAIRLDSDENITDRTSFILGGLGLYPKPKRLILKKCLRFCHYNAIQFLNQLWLLTKDDDFFHERILPFQFFTWNEMLILNAICHLEFPMLLRELMDRLPAFPRDELLPQIPYPVYPKWRKQKYDNPYEEPIWADKMNWTEKSKIDRLNRCRAYMETKRVKIPQLALVRRPSLVDARPMFLAQIEANENASRRIPNVKQKKKFKKHRVQVFDSSVDVTAIAEIQPSEGSTTDKGERDDVCVFLREPLKKPEYAEDEVEEEGESNFLPEVPDTVLTEINRFRPCFDYEELCEDEEDIPFNTPPKTESGATIEQPCIPPDCSPGPPATHYDFGRRELDIINEELCTFQPFVSSSTQTVNRESFGNDEEVTMQLMSAAQKLKKYASDETDEKSPKKKGSKSQYKSKKKKKTKILNPKTKGTGLKLSQKSKQKQKSKEKKGKKDKKDKKDEKDEKDKKDKKDEKDNKEKRLEKEKKDKKERMEKLMKKDKKKRKQEKGEQEGEEVRVEDLELQFSEEQLFEDDDFLFLFENKRRTDKKNLLKKESATSDPDPDYEDEWKSRLPCLRDLGESEDAEPVIIPKKTKAKKRRKHKRRKSRKNKKEKEKEKAIKKENITEWLKEREEEEVINITDLQKLNKETMTECYPGEYDHLYSEEKARAKEANKNAENVFRGNVTSLLRTIINDLAEEGFLSASFEDILLHPDITQLIQYLKGEIVTQEKKERLLCDTKLKWLEVKEIDKIDVPELGIPKQRLMRATWADKTWICREANLKKDEFYFKAAWARANFGRRIYTSLYQNYFGSARYLKIYYAYILSKYEDAILRGVIF